MRAREPSRLDYSNSNFAICIARVWSTKVIESYPLLDALASLPEQRVEREHVANECLKWFAILAARIDSLKYVRESEYL